MSTCQWSKLQFAIVFCCITVLLFNNTSCSSTRVSSQSKRIDNSLVGIWEGSEKNFQFEGVERKWITERKSDGTYIIEFTEIYEADTAGVDTEQFVEEGKWWVKNGIFYEYHNVSSKTDKYRYTILNSNEVKFELLESALEFNNKNYVFIDKRVTK